MSNCWGMIKHDDIFRDHGNWGLIARDVITKVRNNNIIDCEHGRHNAGQYYIVAAVNLYPCSQSNLLWFLLLNVAVQWRYVGHSFIVEHQPAVICLLTAINGPITVSVYTANKRYTVPAGNIDSIGYVLIYLTLIHRKPMLDPRRPRNAKR